MTVLVSTGQRLSHHLRAEVKSPVVLTAEGELKYKVEKIL